MRTITQRVGLLCRYTAGWGPGQLAAECRRGVWLCVSANKHAIFRCGGKSACLPPLGVLWQSLKHLQVAI